MSSRWHWRARLAGYQQTARPSGYDNVVITGKTGSSASVPRAEASANLYSLIETAKVNGYEPYAYLRQVFKELPKATTLEQIIKRQLTWPVGDAAEILDYFGGSTCIPILIAWRL